MITSYVSNAFLSLLEHLVDVIAPRLCWRSVSICFSRCQNSKAHILTLEDWLMTSVLQSSSVGSIHVSHLHLARAPVASSTLPLSVTSVSLSISKTSSTILPSFLGSIHCSKWSTHVRHSFCPSFFFFPRDCNTYCYQMSLRCDFSLRQFFVQKYILLPGQAFSYKIHLWLVSLVLWCLYQTTESMWIGSYLGLMFRKNVSFRACCIWM